MENKDWFCRGIGTEVLNPTSCVTFIESNPTPYIVSWAIKRRDYFVYKAKKRIAIRNIFIVGFAIAIVLALWTCVFMLIYPYLDEISGMIYGYCVAKSLLIIEMATSYKFPTKTYNIKFEHNGTYL